MGKRSSKSKAKKRGGSRQAQVDVGRTRSALMGRFTKRLAADGVPDDDLATYRDVVESAIDFKDDYGHGASPGDWQAGPALEVITEIMPAKTMADEEYARCVVPAMCAYLDFLVAEGRLVSPVADAETVKARLRADEADIVRSFLSIETKSVAGRIAALAQAEGVDFTDRGQLDEFMADFNARPLAERDAVFSGASFDGLVDPERLDQESAWSDDEPEYASEREDDADAGVVRVIRAPQEAQEAALRALPLMGALERVAAWVGPGRDVADGLPPEEELDDFCDAIGLDVPRQKDGAVGALPVALWLTARELGVIELSEQRVGPGEQAWPPAGDEFYDRACQAVEAFLLTDFVLHQDHRENPTRAQRRDAEETAGAYGAMLAIACEPEGIDPKDFVRDTDLPQATERRIRKALTDAMHSWRAAGIVEEAPEGWRVPGALQEAVAGLFEVLGLNVAYTPQP